MGLLPEIRQKIDAWLEGGNGRSPALLSRLAGLSQSTTRRIIQGESASSFANLGNILSVVLEGEDSHLVGSLLKKQYPAEIATIEAFLGKGTLPSDFREKLNELINTNPITSVVYAACNSGRGISLDEVEHEYGRSGIRALNCLEEVNLVEQHNGCFKTSNNECVNFTVQSFKNALKGHIDNLIEENLEKNQAFGSIQWGTISRDGYREVLNASKRFMQEIEALISKNHGHMPIYSLSLTNSYFEVESLFKMGEKK